MDSHFAERTYASSSPTGTAFSKGDLATFQREALKRSSSLGTFFHVLSQVSLGLYLLLSVQFHPKARL